MTAFLSKHLDDILMLIGCGLVLYGTWQVLPVATWFVGGGMCLIAGVLVGMGQGARRDE